MLWAFVAASALCAGMAGASAVWLVRDGQGDISRLRAETQGLTERCDTAQKQIEALRILLGQAQQWIAAQKTAQAAGAKP